MGDTGKEALRWSPGDGNAWSERLLAQAVAVSGPLWGWRAVIPTSRACSVCVCASGVDAVGVGSVSPRSRSETVAGIQRRPGRRELMAGCGQGAGAVAGTHSAPR